MNKLSFPTRKLKGSLRRITTRYYGCKERLSTYGVTNTEGLVITGKESSEDKSKYIIVTENQFAYNPYRVNVGSIGLAPSGFSGIVSPAYVVFEVTDDIVPQFLYYYLKSAIGLNLIRWYGNRGGVRLSLGFEQLGDIDFPDISREQQLNALTRVNEHQSKLDVFLKEQNNQKYMIQKLRQAILQEAVSGKLVPQDQMAESAEEQIKRVIEDRITSYERIVQNAKYEGRRIPKKPKNIQFWEKNKEIFFHEGKTPKTWANTYFINLCLLQRGFDLPRHQFKKGDYPVASSGGVMGYHNEFRVKGPGVFTGRSGSVGKVYYIDSDYWPHNTTLFVKDFNGNKPKYVYYALKAYGIESESASTAVATLNRNKLFKMRILIPPFNEQVRIANKIDGLMNLCDELEDQVEENQENAELLMEAVLKEAFAS